MRLVLLVCLRHVDTNPEGPTLVVADKMICGICILMGMDEAVIKLKLHPPQ